MSTHAMRKEGIQYSQCWEDPDVLAKALRVGEGDTVLSITSGGDNTLSLISYKPAQVHSVDFNATQNFTLELKRCAAVHLSYGEYLAFLGVTPNNGRLELFARIRESLSPEASAWWSAHPKLIVRGVIHAGRFERFTSLFARFVLPFIQSKARIKKMLSFTDVVAQGKFYDSTWNTPLWRFFFGIAASKLLLRRAREQAMFTHTKVANVSAVYLHRLERHLRTRIARGNYFLTYSLTGAYGTALPPYLTEAGHEAIRASSPKTLHIETNDLISYLRTKEANSISAFNLSDVFEALSPEEHEALWLEIVRTGKSGARIAYWTNLVPRPVPDTVASRVKDEKEAVETLRGEDRVFFYDTVHVHTLLP